MKDSALWQLQREYNNYRRNAVNCITMTYGTRQDIDTAIRILEWRIPNCWDELYRHTTALRNRLKELSPDDPLLDKPRPVERKRTPLMIEAAKAFAENNDSWILAEELDNNVGRADLPSR